MNNFNLFDFLVIIGPFFCSFFLTLFFNKNFLFNKRKTIILILFFFTLDTNFIAFAEEINPDDDPFKFTLSNVIL